MAFLAFLLLSLLVVAISLCVNVSREKGQDLTQSYDKSPCTNRPLQKVTTHKRNKNVDYTTIAGRFRTVSWSNNNYPTGEVKPVYGIPTFPLTAKAV